MRNLPLLLLTSLFLSGCSTGTSNKEGDEETELATPVDEPESSVSYEDLDSLLKNRLPIWGDYLKISTERNIEGNVREHQILLESSGFIIVRSVGGMTASKSHYMLSFSKETGKLLDYINIGTEAEGVDPHKIVWSSASDFSTVDYTYELVEDEESGAYMKGDLLDSTVHYFSIDASGEIVDRKP